MADGKVTITVDLDGTSAQQGVKRLKSLLQGLGDTSSSGFNQGGKSALGFGAAMAVASAVVQKGMSAISSSMGGAISRYDTMNKFPKMMSALGYSADDAKNAVDELSKGIDGLPTALDEVVATAQGLTMMNGDLGKSTKLTLALNNAFLSSGASAGDASRGLIQFTQMMAKGEVDMQSWRTLMETMPVGLDKVAEAFGYTGASAKNDLYAALKEGHITFDQFSDKLIELNEGVGGFAELAQINSDGIATAMSRIKTAVVRNMEGVIRSFDEAAKAKGLPTITEGLDKFRLSINSAFSSATPYVSKFVDVLSWVVDAAKRMWEAFKDTGAVTALSNAFTAVKGAIGHVFSSLGQNKGLVEGLGKAFGEVVKWISDAITKAAEFISSLPPGTIQGIASAILGAVAAFKGFKTVQGILKVVSSTFGLIKAALSANPFMLAVVGIGALVGAFIHAYNTSEKFRAKVDSVVASVKKFLSNLDPERLKSWAATIAAVAGGFAIFKMLNGWNPFATFGTGGKTALDKVKNALFGTSNQATQSKGIIEQVFSGLGTLISSIAQGISTVLQGLATAISTVAQGFGQAASMANPAQWLAMGAAMLMVGAGVALASAGIYILVQAAIQLASAGSGAALALAGLGVGIAAMAGVFALLGPALTASAVGMVAFGATVALIGAGIGMAAAALAMLASQLPTIATYGSSAATGILALSAAVIAFGAGVTVAGAGLVVLSAGLIAFGAVAVVAAAGGTVLAAGIVVVSAAVAAFGLALKPVASAVKKMGQGAKDAGTGTKQLASGLKTITALPLGSLVTHLGAVAIGIGKISSKGAEIGTVASGMKKLGQGLTTIASSGVKVATSLSTVGTIVTQLSTHLTTLPAILTLVATGFATFAGQAVASTASLSAVNAPLSALKSQITSLIPAFTMAGTGLSVFVTQMTRVSGSLTALSSRLNSVKSSLISVSTGFIQVGASATTASGQVKSMTTSTQLVITAFNTMRDKVQTSMNSVLNIIKTVGGQMKEEGGRIGRETSQNLAKGISSGIGQVSNAMQSLLDTAKTRGMAGVAVMRTVGSQIGQGLAQGMMSALGAVTAAANALVAQAERAAQAKAKIHSPSRLFRDNVGRFISQGVAVGITKDGYKVDDAMGDVYKQIQAFNFKAEDVIGIGKAKLSKVVQTKQSIEQAVRTRVEIAKEKSNSLIEKALDIADKAIEQPTDIYLDGKTLVGRTGDRQKAYFDKKAKIYNRTRGKR